ncbi:MULTISPECIES: stage II sporulation protein M [Chryseobacterium]|uniref:Membrane protein SpoIIM required for sporulation n=1 Tax=Chryseobacterium camelliae TaxID=1265445 RepID=A0ABU0TNN7_9FLAO|nr:MULTISPECIES: stage II sporulation protein M [Chryseobacterium]MDQ1098663.1 putative membrane protein SpoIIM required for sporulation [Chryseobacterium camelliae]MDR6086021.1 putative membrane protein SpoIIM required for sporulation [Chryseobacterium sp. SORGH_AS_0909]MDR6130388.1 putative membrane protein SpoIIM required for sporulation [Chryseobacterium sp. SORGH_AS_1175]MDT3407484.1 putative membrane protein SpoIIM required for sporulation [Pseudacidovorax intermedius]
MREVYFIKQNKEKWLGIEQVIQGKVKKNPDDLSSLYINLINDLSFAQTYYPKSNTTVYLNHLSSQIFQKIYKTRRVEQNRITYFFGTEVPLLVYRYRRYLLYAFLFFILFTLIGVISSIYDKDFVNIILGEGYVNETIENIKKGNAVGIYQTGSTWGSTTGIIFNNIGVGAKLYIYGIFAGIGTLYYLLSNSVMLGSFQYFFYDYGALKDSARGIWLHGVFEIFSMVVEAMCGLILGASILFPRTFSRFQSFKNGFRDSFKIFLSTIPFTVCAGIIEGYVTRHALEMPLFLNLIIIFGSLSIIGFYYFVYPAIVNKKINHQIHDAVL